ncbi:MAG: small ribosomal subunit Rsm22 family protein [Oligoflexia bacterium]|nr:small ribosomal subunit Rsm22 family protein [Oligoflexia bacterium]
MSDQGSTRFSEELEPSLVRAILPPQAQQQYAQGKVSKEFLAPFAESLLHLSKAYVQCEAWRSISRREAQAYALYYLQVNLPKFVRLIRELPSSLRSQPLRVLDYGCGPGTGSMALLSQALQIQSLTAFDRLRPMLDVFTDIVHALACDMRPQYTQDESTALAGIYDLILCGNVFCELEIAKKMSCFHQLCQRLSPGGALVILEPALQETADALVRMRDAFVGEPGEYAVIFPCTHHNPCPLLSSNRGPAWCHATLSWEAPQLVRQLDELTGFGKHRLKYSALIVQRGAIPVGGSRVITEPERTKRGVECMACSASGYERLIIPKKSAPRHLASFDLAPSLPDVPSI